MCTCPQLYVCMKLYMNKILTFYNNNYNKEHTHLTYYINKILGLSTNFFK